jgi:dTDP-4-dehydrorhamnose 3,5-epimerase
MSVAASLSTPKLTAQKTAVEGVLLLQPKVFGDDRGWFLESYNHQSFAEVGIDVEFVQDNHSMSTQNVLRGLHYQVEQTQGKLVRAVVGEIYDVAVDIRRRSPTFGKWTAAHLSAENHRMMWVPEGCAHGFLVVSPVAEVLYKATDFYKPEAERSIIWNDASLNIDWPLAGAVPSLSEKDRKGVPFSKALLFD